MSDTKGTFFYNFTYNLGAPNGQLKFGWGITELDFSEDLVTQLKNTTTYDHACMFNVNLTALNRVE